MATNCKPPLQVAIERILDSTMDEKTKRHHIAALFPEKAAAGDEYTIDRPYLEQLFKSLGAFGATKEGGDGFRLWPIVWLTNELYLDTTDLSVRHCIMSKKPLATIITRSQLEWLMAGLGVGFSSYLAGFDFAGDEVVEAPEKAETTETRVTEVDPPVEFHPVWEHRVEGPKEAHEFAVQDSEHVLRLAGPAERTIRFHFDMEGHPAPREIARLDADGIFRVSVDPSDQNTRQFIQVVNALCGWTDPPIDGFKGIVATDSTSAAEFKNDVPVL